MNDKIKSKMDEFRVALNSKNNYLITLRSTMAQTQKEIDMLTGAVQALEQIIESTEEKDEPTKTGRK